VCIGERLTEELSCVWFGLWCIEDLLVVLPKNDCGRQIWSASEFENWVFGWCRNKQREKELSRTKLAPNNVEIIARREARRLYLRNDGQKSMLPRLRNMRRTTSKRFL